MGKIRKLYEKYFDNKRALFIVVEVFALIITASNTTLDNVLYATQRSALIGKITEQIRAGEISDFLGQNTHSWVSTLYLAYLEYLFNVHDMYLLHLAVQMFFCNCSAD